MSLLVWIVVGLLAGFVASNIVGERAKDFALDTVLGVVGAVVGGWMFTIFEMEEGRGMNLYSLLVAVIGAILTLITYHLLIRSAR